MLVDIRGSILSDAGSIPAISTKAHVNKCAPFCLSDCAPAIRIIDIAPTLLDLYTSPLTLPILLRCVRWFYILKYMDDLPVFINQKGRAQNTHDIHDHSFSSSPTPHTARILYVQHLPAVGTVVHIFP